MKFLINLLIVMVVAAVLIYGAFDEDSQVRGRVLGALILIAALPLFFMGLMVYDAVKVRKEKRTTWRKAFSLAMNKPAKINKKDGSKS